MFFWCFQFDISKELGFKLELESRCHFEACFLFVKQELKQRQTQNTKQANVNAGDVSEARVSKLFDSLPIFCEHFLHSVKLESNVHKYFSRCYTKRITSEASCKTIS